MLTCFQLAGVSGVSGETVTGERVKAICTVTVVTRVQ